MLIEKVIRLAINIVVGIWMARQLGPSDFGTLSLAIALSAILLPLVNLGLHGILVKELYDHPDQKATIMGTAFIMKTGASVLIFAILLFVVFQGHIVPEYEKNIIVFACVSILFQGFLVIESWYESQVKPKWATIFKTIFFVLSSALKVYFILRDAEVYVFAILYSVEAFLIAIGLLAAYLRDKEPLLNWRFDKSVSLGLLSKSWLLIFSSMSAVVYLKIDQVMLGTMVSDAELGYYSAAVKLSEAWYFVPLIISNALFPAILSAKKKSVVLYMKRLQQLSDFYFICAASLALIVTFSAPMIITMLYGIAYTPSIIILQLHIWAGIFIFLRTILSKWLIVEEKFRFSLISQVSGAIANVGLNFWLIPLWGGIGAAIATLASYFIGAILVLGLFKDTKDIFRIFVRTLAFPIKPFLK